MQRLIKREKEEDFGGKIDDENNLKCGEIVFSNNIQFFFSCIFCNRVCGKVQEFFRHILYDHLSYLDEYQFSDDEDYSVQKILETNRKTKQPPPIAETVFVDVDLKQEPEKIHQIDFLKHFENFVSDVTPSECIKVEMEDDKDDETYSDHLSDCDLPFKSEAEHLPAEQSNPQDILHIEILDRASGSDYEIENTGFSNENSNEHNSRNSEDDEDDPDYFEQHDQLESQSDNETYDDEEAKKNATEDEPSETKENEYNCPHCSKVFTTKAGVKRHISNIHKQSHPEQLACDKCDKTFKSENQLLLHTKRHLGVKPHSCDICGASFSDKSNLNVHILRHKGIKPHKCTLCEKSFHSTTERKLHLRSHTGERPFVCEVCGRKFSNSGHLCSHRRRHFDEKRFQCDQCEKRFFDRKLLNDHKVMHTDERPFSCDACGATFQRKKALLQHEKLHSGVKQYVCKICGKSFAQNAGLYSHMKYH